MMLLSVLFLLFIPIFWIISNRIRVATTFNISSKVHFGLLASFIGLLLVMTVIVELRYPSSESIALPPKVDEHFSEDPMNQILNGKRPDASKVVTTRTHEAEDKLTIEGLIGAEYYDVVTIIERKDQNDGVIEEIIYKPMIAFNIYDLSDEFEITLPKWENQTMTIADVPYKEIELTYFSTTSLFSQFTNGMSNNNHFGSFSSSTSPLVIHLIVPKDLEVDDASHSAIFIDE